MPLVATVVLGTALGGASRLWDVRREGTETAHQGANEKQIDTIVASISNSFAGYAKTVDAVLAQTGAAAAISTGDNAAMAQVAAAVMKELPNAMGAVLTGTKMQEPNYGATPPISFATLDLMRRSRKSGKQVAVEMHLFGRQEQHMAMVRRATNSASTLAGFIVVGFPLDEAERAIAKAPVGEGYVELTQRLPGGQRLVVAKTGNAALKKGLITHTRALPGTAFLLLIWLPEVTASQLNASNVPGESLPILFAIMLLILAGIGSTVWTVRRRQRLKGCVMVGGVVSAVVDDDDDDGPEGAFAQARAKAGSTGGGSAAEGSTGGYPRVPLQMQNPNGCQRRRSMRARLWNIAKPMIAPARLPPRFPTVRFRV